MQREMNHANNTCMNTIRTALLLSRHCSVDWMLPRNMAGKSIVSHDHHVRKLTERNGTKPGQSRAKGLSRNRATAASKVYLVVVNRPDK